MLMDEMFLAMIKKPLDLHVLPNLTSITIIYTSFDLWMVKGDVDFFALVIKFLNESWTLMHVIMGLFEANETNG
jgi:hypothetical protein